MQNLGLFVKPSYDLAMEPERFHYDLENCSIKRALDVLGEKWTLLVLREAIYGVRRFDDFARALKCGRGVLSARLKTLTEAGILKRVEYREGEQRARGEYHLDEKGIDLFTTIYALSQWGDRWMPPPDGPAAGSQIPEMSRRGAGPGFSPFLSKSYTAPGSRA